MMPLSLAGAERLLCLGAHCDDIEIGAGGTILGALARNPELEVAWVVCASNEERRAEARRSADAFLGKAARKRVVVQEFRESYFPWAGDELKSFLEEVKRDFLPDVVLTHWRGDRHQDHRTLGELTWNAFRDQVILEYEIPKWDGDLGRPNVYARAPEGRDPHHLLREPGRQGLVHRGPLPLPAATARHGVPLPFELCGGLLRLQAAAGRRRRTVSRGAP